MMSVALQHPQLVRQFFQAGPATIYAHPFVAVKLPQQSKLSLQILNGLRIAEYGNVAGLEF